MKRKKRSKKYRKIWEDYHRACILPGMHIHHIDGNCENDDPENLLICTPEEHWQIHFDQGDIVAINNKFIQGASEAGKMGGKYKRTKETKDKISKIQKKIWTKERREKQRTTMLKMKDELIEKTIKAQGGKPFKVWKAEGKRHHWKKGEYLGEYINKAECSRLFGVSRSHIRMCLGGKIKQIKGFIFELVEE